MKKYSANSEKTVIFKIAGKEVTKGQNEQTISMTFKRNQCMSNVILKTKMVQISVIDPMYKLRIQNISGIDNNRGMSRGNDCFFLGEGEKEVWVYKGSTMIFHIKIRIKLI